MAFLCQQKSGCIKKKTTVDGQHAVALIVTCWD